MLATLSRNRQSVKARALDATPKSSSTGHFASVLLFQLSITCLLYSAPEARFSVPTGSTNRGKVGRF
jgi:hypothetical protein